MCLQAAGPIQRDSDPLSLEVAHGQWVRWGAVEAALGGKSQKPPAFLSDLGRSEGPVLCPPRVWLGVAWGPRGRLELVGQMSQHSDFQTVLPRTELQQSTSQSPMGAGGGGGGGPRGGLFTALPSIALTGLYLGFQEDFA